MLGFVKLVGHDGLGPGLRRDDVVFYKASANIITAIYPLVVADFPVIV